MINETTTLLQQLRGQGQISAEQYHDILRQAHAANYEWLAGLIRRMKHRLGVR